MHEFLHLLNPAKYNDTDMKRRLFPERSAAELAGVSSSVITQELMKCW
jgi:hypothetical protein